MAGHTWDECVTVLLDRAPANLVRSVSVWRTRVCSGSGLSGDGPEWGEVWRRASTFRGRTRVSRLTLWVREHYRRIEREQRAGSLSWEGLARAAEECGVGEGGRVVTASALRKAFYRVRGDKRPASGVAARSAADADFRERAQPTGMLLRESQNVPVISATDGDERLERLRERLRAGETQMPKPLKREG